MKPTIFISHSAHGDEEATKLVTALDLTLRNEGFEPYLDWKRLQGGDDWRTELDTYLLDCHGGVIVFSQKALKSRWVLKEATILTARHSQDKKKFPILPVLLSPVTPKELTDDVFSPLAISEIQAIASDDPDTLLLNIKERLLSVKDVLSNLESPLQSRVKQIAGILSRVPPPIVSEALELLGETDSAKLNDGRILAQRLVEGGLESLVKVLGLLAPQIGREAAHTITDIVAPFWVDSTAAGRIPVVADRIACNRLFAINGIRPFTGISYIKRACSKYPTWMIVPIPNKCGEDQKGGLLGQIRAQIRRRFDITDEVSDQDVDDIAQSFLESDHVFLVLPPPVPESNALAEIATTFPGFTICLLSGQTFIDGGAPALPSVEVIKPYLEEAVEKNAWIRFFKAQAIVEQMRI